MGPVMPADVSPATPCVPLLDDRFAEPSTLKSHGTHGAYGAYRSHTTPPAQAAVTRVAAVLAIAALAMAGCGPRAAAPTVAVDGMEFGSTGAEPPSAGSTAAPLSHADPEADPDHDGPNAPAGTPGETGLVIYSGRTESLIGPLLEAFEATAGVRVDVRYGDTGELAVTMLEEGARSPADVFLVQEPGGLGAVRPMLAPLPAEVLDRVDPAYRAKDGTWVGLSGRVRVVVYNTDALTEGDLPSDIRGFTDPKWKGRIGWAPSNASLHAMISAMRAAWGDDETRRWIEGIVANEPHAYDKNGPVVEAVAKGEVDVGFVNHYYLYNFLTEQGDGFKARNAVLRDGGPASILLVAGIGILKTAAHPEAALRFVHFLLDHEAQAYFAEKTWEYPLASGVKPDPKLPDLTGLPLTPFDLTTLGDVEGSVTMLRDAGALP